MYSGISWQGYKHRKNIDELNFDGTEKYWAWEALKFFSGGYKNLPEVPFDQENRKVLKMIAIVCSAISNAN